jgi:hypothetical protein
LKFSGRGESMHPMRTLIVVSTIQLRRVVPATVLSPSAPPALATVHSRCGAESKTILAAEVVRRCAEFVACASEHPAAVIRMGRVSHRLALSRRSNIIKWSPSHEDPKRLAGGGGNGLDRVLGIKIWSKGQPDRSGRARASG